MNIAHATNSSLSEILELPVKDRKILRILLNRLYEKAPEEVPE